MIASKKSRKPLLVLAHTPPPFHGQSLMVARMLEAFRGTTAPGETLTFFHIDCRYSASLESLGRLGFQKLFLPLRYALQALGIRFRYGAKTLYYIPAPAKRPAFLRDCFILLLLRPFFHKIIFHWHAAGLGPWLEHQATAVERWIGRKILSGSDLSIVLLAERADDAAYFRPRQLAVIPNGIPDPCLDFATVMTRRRQRSGPVRLLFLSTASKEKGVFTAVSVWRELNERAARNSGPFYRLAIAGTFPDPTEKLEFEEFRQSAQRAIQQAVPSAAGDGEIQILGGVYDDRKAAVFSEADIFLFPSVWESFGLAPVEAAFFGLPSVTFQPVVGPDGLSPLFHRRVPLGDIDSFVRAVEDISLENGQAIRDDAMRKFNLELFGKRMRHACLGVEE